MLTLWMSPSLSPGDQRGGAGLPAAPTHGLSHGAASAHAGLLGEGEEHAAQVHPDRGHVGQAHPQRGQPQGGHQQHAVLRVGWPGFLFIGLILIKPSFTVASAVISWNKPPPSKL